MRYFLLIILIVMGISSVSRAQDDEPLDIHVLCTQEQAQDALDLLEEWNVLTNVDLILEALEGTDYDLSIILHDMYVTRQSYYVEVEPNFPQCSQVHLFDYAFSQYWTNLMLSGTAIALEVTGQRDYRDWGTFAVNINDSLLVMRAQFSIYRGLLEASAEQ